MILKAITEQARNITENRDPTKIGKDAISLNPGHTHDLLNLNEFNRKCFIYKDNSKEPVGSVFTFEEILEKCTSYEQTKVILNTIRQEIGNRIASINIMLQSLSLKKGMEENLETVKESKKEDIKGAIKEIGEEIETQKKKYIESFILIRNILVLFQTIIKDERFDLKKFKTVPVKTVRYPGLNPIEIKGESPNDLWINHMRSLSNLLEIETTTNNIEEIVTSINKKLE